MKLRIVFTLILASLALPLSVTAQEQRAPDNFFIYTGIDTTGCLSNDLGFTLAYGSIVDNYWTGTLATADGEVYMDEDTGFFNPGTGSGTWNLYDTGLPGGRGMQTAPFPLPADTKIAVASTVFSDLYEPVWRSVAKLTKCNGGVVKKVTNFKAKEVLDNNSFELFDAGDMMPLDWTHNAGAEVGTTHVTCDTGFVGACYLRIDPGLDTTQSFKQVWTGIKGAAGDTVELALFQRTMGGYTGGGKITAKLTFSDGTSNTLQFFALSEDTDDWVYSVLKLTLPAPLTKAVITLKQVNGTGSDWDIDGISLAIYTKSNFLPAVQRVLPAL